MALENYQDLSQTSSELNAGFAFEFACSCCARKWRSPFKPYRKGQLAGILSMLAQVVQRTESASRLTDGISDAGVRGARETALAEAMVQAQALYTVCDACHQAVCQDCYDQDAAQCAGCLKDARNAATSGSPAAAGGGLACSNCRSPCAGVRFCGECGFDMASTHKSCPACAAMVLRQARFCTDCGHGF